MPLTTPRLKPRSFYPSLIGGLFLVQCKDGNQYLPEEIPPLIAMSQIDYASLSEGSVISQTNSILALTASKQLPILIRLSDNHTFGQAFEVNPNSFVLTTFSDVPGLGKKLSFPATSASLAKPSQNGRVVDFVLHFDLPSQITTSTTYLLSYVEIEGSTIADEAGNALAPADNLLKFQVVIDSGAPRLTASSEQTLLKISEQNFFTITLTLIDDSGFAREQISKLQAVEVKLTRSNGKEIDGTIDGTIDFINIERENPLQWILPVLFATPTTAETDVAYTLSFTHGGQITDLVGNVLPEYPSLATFTYTFMD